MEIQNLYAKDIHRPFEAVVDINKFETKIVETEIGEYVFTEEIISGLFQILSGIRFHKVTHNGTWINGYYGSGKSHFLKYLKYCFSKTNQEEALKRLEQAVRETNLTEVKDPSKFPSPSEIVDIIQWLKKADVDDIAFNFGDEDNKNEEEDKSFVHVFWRMFHKFRGYNRESLAIGHYLERVLDEAGKLEEFKKRLENLNIDWDDALSSYLSDPDTIMDVARELKPKLNVDAIRNRIDNNDLDASVSNFCDTLSKYIKTKGNQYRLIFFADEASQYIDGRKNVLLQLQQLSATLETKCGDKVWIICTAQQGLEEVLDECHVDKKSDEFGNIIDRFPVRVSLEEVNSTYITQKRFLEKDGNGTIILNDLYTSKRTDIEGQFKLPVGYNSFDDKDSFEINYPFVPYQFELIKKVLRAFRSLEYVEKTVKDSERSILRIAYNAANTTRGYDIGSIIPFDLFLPSLGVLAHNGKVAISTPKIIAGQYTDPGFAMRVVHALFMLCHMKEDDKNSLPASIDNLSTLLISKIGEDMKSLREKVEGVINYFMESNILKKERPEGANYDIFSFYTEEESEVATIIKNTPSGGDTAIAEMLKPIINKYWDITANRQTFGATNVNIGMSIFDLYAQGGNYDLMINMMFYADSDNPDAIAMNNNKKNLIFFLAPLWKNDKQLQRDINWCCRFNNYLKEPVTSPLRNKINDDFRMKAQELKKGIIKKVEEYLDKCEVISGNDVITSKFTGHKGVLRYKYAIESHFRNFYKYAHLADGLPTSANELRDKMLRPIAPGEYNGLPMTEAEKEVERYLNSTSGRYGLADLVNHYKSAPYGWREESTIYVVNELVRRHKRTFIYKGGSVKITPQVQANTIVKNKADFEIETATEVPLSLINDFILAWRDIFNVQTVPGGNDSTQLYMSNKENSDSYLNEIIDHYSVTYSEVSRYPFSTAYSNAIVLFKEWQKIDGEKAFFEGVIAKQKEAKEVMDECKAVQAFVNQQLSKYKEILAFIKANEANFQHLEVEEKPVIEKLQQLAEDATPYATGKFPTYVKLYKEVKEKVVKAIEQAKNKIKDNYEAVYAQLLEIVNSKEIPTTVLSDLEAKITSASASTDIATLLMRSDTSSFFAEQINAINKYKKPVTDSHDENESEDENSDEDEQPAPRVIKNVKLMKPQIQILSNRDEVEAYLQLLRKQLMSHIDNGEDVVIS